MIYMVQNKNCKKKPGNQCKKNSRKVSRKSSKKKPARKSSRSSSKKKSSRNLSKIKLPQPNKRYSLRKYGYSVSKADKTRKTSLKKASKDYGAVPVIRRLNLARNLQSDETSSKAKNIMAKDVKWLSDQYKTGKI